jgi:hypothetical protein
MTVLPRRGPPPTTRIMGRSSEEHAAPVEGVSLAASGAARFREELAHPATREGTQPRGQRHGSSLGGARPPVAQSRQELDRVGWSFLLREGASVVVPMDTGAPAGRGRGEGV